MESVISESGYYMEHYSCVIGYQPSDFENEVRIHYAGVDSTIAKKEFYELCLLLCNAKLNLQENKEEKLLSIKSQLEEKIKMV